MDDCKGMDALPLSKCNLQYEVNEYGIGTTRSRR